MIKVKTNDTLKINTALENIVKDNNLKVKAITINNQIEFKRIKIYFF